MAHHSHSQKWQIAGAFSQTTQNCWDRVRLVSDEPSCSPTLGMQRFNQPRSRSSPGLHRPRGLPLPPRCSRSRMRHAAAGQPNYSKLLGPRRPRGMPPSPRPPHTAANQPNCSKLLRPRGPRGLPPPLQPPLPDWHCKNLSPFAARCATQQHVSRTARSCWGHAGHGACRRRGRRGRPFRRPFPCRHHDGRGPHGRRRRRRLSAQQDEVQQTLFHI